MPSWSTHKYAISFNEDLYECVLSNESDKYWLTAYSICWINIG